MEAPVHHEPCAASMVSIVIIRSLVGRNSRGRGLYHLLFWISAHGVTATPWRCWRALPP